jgi:hypothetical protein
MCKLVQNIVDPAANGAGTPIVTTAVTSSALRTAAANF